MTTILGFHISVIRPMRPRNPIIFKSDLPRPTYNTKPVTKACGKVQEVTIMLKDRGVRAVAMACTHLEVCQSFNIQPEDVLKTGWVLEDGTEVWR